MHFLHVRSPLPGAIPPVLSHGRPGSGYEYPNVLGPLSGPARYGLDTGVSFDPVLPSLPGFGFSGPAPDTGWGVQRIARAWLEPMTRPGYDRFGALGNDRGPASRWSSAGSHRTG
ncbi:hypothetical protein [Nocardiopsis potens]|uniref:hypothetical protein n=1 Tax=Nocardiopsis potens TaxID=1246458 RepID=UPI00034BD883|nr:hypothetical protein [Nocardiopsis potens]